MTITRPELPGTLTPGMPVWVRRSRNDRSGQGRYIEARIVSAARVWVTIERADLPPSAIGYQTWRMRRDTQDEGTQYSGSNASFLTEAQYRYERRLNNARDYLTEQGIRVDQGSPWWKRDIELADALRRGTGAQ